MSFFSRIKKIFSLSLADPKAWDPSLWNLRGSISESGETVTEETALTYSAVWNAITLISGTVGTLPLHLMQRQDNNRKKIASDIPTYSLLHDYPNPYMTAMAFRETIAAHILTWGNGYAEKVMNGYGEVKALWPIPPNRVTKMEMRDDQLWYEIDVDSERKWLPRSKILHIPGLGFDGFIGYSPISMARKSLGLGMAMETFGSRYFGEGTHPGLVITQPGWASTSAQTRANLRQATEETYKGLTKTQKTMFLDEAQKVEKIGIPPNDSQFLESRQFQIPEVARWFNLPPHKLKDLTKSSFNNIEQEQISFVTDSILPWLIRFEQNYNMQLLTPTQAKQNLYFKHIVEGLLRGDAKSRGEFYQIMKRNGIMTINEIRDKEDLNPHEDPLADELWTEANMTPLSKWDQSTFLAPEPESEENENRPQLQKPAKFPALVEGKK